MDAENKAALKTLAWSLVKSVVLVAGVVLLVIAGIVTFGFLFIMFGRHTQRGYGRGYGRRW